MEQSTAGTGLVKRINIEMLKLCAIWVLASTAAGVLGEALSVAGQRMWMSADLPTWATGGTGAFVAKVALGPIAVWFLLGSAQGLVLRHHVCELRSIKFAWWIPASMGGGAVAVLLAMYPMMTLFAASVTLDMVLMPGTIGWAVSIALGIIFSVVVGAVAGLILGAIQWLVFRSFLRDCAQWMAANALGWGAGLATTAFLPGDPFVVFNLASTSDLWVRVLTGGCVIAIASVPTAYVFARIVQGTLSQNTYFKGPLY